MTGNIGSGIATNLRQFADIALALAQLVENGQPSRIGQDMKVAGYRLHGGGGHFFGIHGAYLTAD